MSEKRLLVFKNNEEISLREIDGLRELFGPIRIGKFQEKGVYAFNGLKRVVFEPVQCFEQFVLGLQGFVHLGNRVCETKRRRSLLLFVFFISKPWILSFPPPRATERQHPSFSLRGPLRQCRTKVFLSLSR